MWEAEQHELSELRGLEGLLVQVSGVGSKLDPFVLDYEDRWLEPVEVDQKVGRCLDFRDVEEKYLVQLFSGDYVLISEQHLHEYTPPEPESGGFDVAWPSCMPDEDISGSEGLPAFAQLLCDIIDNRGWCLIQMIVGEGDRLDAVDEACRLQDFTSLKRELLPDYLGRGGTGKLHMLDQSRQYGDQASPALSDYDSELTALAKALSPLTEERLGFKASGRRKGMVWLPSATSAEKGEEDLETQALTEEDVDAGVVEAHLKFLQQRRLCFMYWIDNEGGTFTLYPREDYFPSAQPVRLPLSSSKLLVFRCDWMTYSYKPIGRQPLALATWVVDSSEQGRLTYAYIDGEDEQTKALAMGIMVGPPMPVGYRMHIMAMHTHTPAGVYDEGDFSTMIASGSDGFMKIPIERFDTDIYCTEGEEKDPFRSYVVHGALMATEDLVKFDSEFFGITADEAIHMAPCQRLVLQDGYHTLYKAGLRKKTLAGRMTSSSVGDTGTDWNPFQVLGEPEGGYRNPLSGQAFGNVESSPYQISGVKSIITAARLAHCLGMAGPSHSVDTACSASLVGLNVCVQGLRKPDESQVPSMSNTRSIDAVCMGVSTLMDPMTFIGLCGPQMLAKKGRCLTFDVSAEGYARGDGFGGVYVKPSDAEEDNLNQVACLMGSMVNQDGRSATLTAPNGVAQQQCIRFSMQEAAVVASQITIAECHGTGTALGDPIEVGALRGVMEPRATPLLTTSAKSNIGHLEACAGIIGLVKCVTMVRGSNSSPNVHLLQLNPHLDVEGFPAYFENELSSTGLNSNFAGVSSFGFSGTNARADVWSQCKYGPNRAGSRGYDLDMVDQVHVQCPVTMGIIELLTGEPVTSSFKAKGRYKADVVRDEWAPYDISRSAYKGGFRYRREPPAEEVDEDLDPEVGVFICGSWSGFRKMEAMEREGGGWYSATIALGESRCELFDLCLNEDRSLTLYPAIRSASQRIWVEGPNGASGGRKWLIDGRDEEVKAGTTFQVRFRWHSDVKCVQWAPTTRWRDPLVLRHEHQYSIVGTFSSEAYIPMRCLSDGEGTWEATFRIGCSGQEEFAISRDEDPDQMVYPARPQAVLTSVPARGPDDLGGGKRWLVRGVSNELITVRLQILDAKVTVTVTWQHKGSKTWESIQGWDRHQYCVAGSWTQWQPIAMVMSETPGVFKAYAKMRELYSKNLEAFVEAFQINVDEDAQVAFYPVVDGAGPGEVIALGPDGAGADKNWVVCSGVQGQRFVITLDLTAADRREMVRCSLLDPGEATTGEAGDLRMERISGYISDLEGE